MVKVNKPLLAAVKAAATIDDRGRASLVRDVDREFRKNETALFASQGASASSTWAPLSARYRARKDRIFAGAMAFNRGLARARGSRVTPGAIGAVNKILQFTGDMKRRLTVAGNPDHIAQAEGPTTRFRIVVGSRGRIENYHYVGGAHLPVRNPIAHTSAQTAAYLGVVRSFFIERVRAVTRHFA